MAGSEIEADDCSSCIRCPYKTTGFAPRVSYSASSPSRLTLPPSIALASYVRTAAVVSPASAS